MESQQKKEYFETIGADEFLRLKNEAQIRMMIDAGIDLNDNNSMTEWINANSILFEKLFDLKMASNFESEPSETILLLKGKLYH